MIRPKVSSLFLSFLFAISSMANWAVASEKEKVSPSQGIMLLVDDFTPENRGQEDPDLAFTLRTGLIFSLRAYPAVSIVNPSGQPTAGSSEIGQSRLEGAVSRRQENDVHRLEASYYSKGTFVNLNIRITRGPNEETVFNVLLKFERTAALTNMELLARRLANKFTQFQQFQYGERTAMPVRWRRGAVGCFETSIDPASPMSREELESKLVARLIEELVLGIGQGFPDLFIGTGDEFDLDCSGDGAEALLMAVKGPDFLVSGRIEAKPTTFVVRPTLFAKGFPMPLRLPEVQVPHDDWYDLVFLVFSGVANFLFAGRDDQGFWSEPELVSQQDRPGDLISIGRERLRDNRPNRAALYFIVARDRSRERQPQYDQASLGLAQSRQKQSLGGEARQILEQIRESESASVASEAYRILGDLAYESGKSNDARDAYLKAYELGNRSSSLLWRGAESQLLNRNQEEKDKEIAFKFLSEWVDHQPVALERFVSAASLLDEYGAKEEAGRILLKASTTEIEPELNTLDTTLDFIDIHNLAASTERYDVAKSIGEKVVSLAHRQEGAEGSISLGLGHAILGYSESARYVHTEESEIDEILYHHKTALDIFTKFRQMAPPDIDFGLLDVMYHMELLNYSEVAFVAQKYEMSRDKSQEAIDEFSDLVAGDIGSGFQGDIVISYLLLTISQIMLGDDESEKSYTLLEWERDRLGDGKLNWDFSFVDKAAADQMKDLCEGGEIQASGCKNMKKVCKILKETSQSEEQCDETSGL